MKGQPDVHHRIAAAQDLIAGMNPSRESGLSITNYWHHSTRFSDGSSIDMGKTLEHLQVEYAAVFDSLPVEGATVLDIGAWQGSFSFEAERRGARRVVAADGICWLEPDLKGLETFLLIKKDKKSSVDWRVADLSQTTAANLGTFDIVLFLGIFYHLQDPVTYLSELRRLTTKHLVLETWCDLFDDPLPAMRYYPGKEIGGDASNWWGPNPPCVAALLKTAGFTEVRIIRHPADTNRCFFHAS